MCLRWTPGALTEAQVQALEKKKLDDEAWGEIETAHPGYLGSQDTFYVGTLKGVGRIYQQTYVDRRNPKLVTQEANSPFVFLPRPRSLISHSHDFRVVARKEPYGGLAGATT
jgi:hypothetical protein